jgi:DNA-directed RNA polymerase specialized sigma24 family protein
MKDILQEIAWRVWYYVPGLELLRGRIPAELVLIGWLKRVIPTVVYRQHRKEVSHVSLEEGGGPGQMRDDEQWREILVRDFCLDLEKGIEGLSEEDKEILSERANGLTFREIAEKLNARGKRPKARGKRLTEGSVKMRHNRACNKVRQNLERGKR